MNIPKMSVNKPELGMIQLSLMGWIAIGAAVVIGLMYLRIGYLETKVELADAFKASVQAAGEAARKEANRINKENLAKKEKADAQINKLRTDNANLAKRLRDDRASRSYVPEAAPGSPSPERATFDREKLERAIQRLDEQLSGLIERGDEGLKTIEELKAWAQQ